MFIRRRPKHWGNQRCIDGSNYGWPTTKGDNESKLSCSHFAYGGLQVRPAVCAITAGLLQPSHHTVSGCLRGNISCRLCSGGFDCWTPQPHALVSLRASRAQSIAGCRRRQPLLSARGGGGLYLEFSIRQQLPASITSHPRSTVPKAAATFRLGHRGRRSDYQWQRIRSTFLEQILRVTFFQIQRVQTLAPNFGCSVDSFGRTAMKRH